MSSQNEPVAAAILNGGKARRMSGLDKSRLEVGGVPIAERQLALLRPRCSPIAMVVADAEQVVDADVEPLLDRVGGLGPLDGIASALAWSPHSWVLILAGDMPDVDPGLLDLLLGARDESLDIIAFEARGRVQPLLALYHRRLLPVLDSRLVAHKLRASDLLESPPTNVSVHLFSEAEFFGVDPDSKSFRNLNRPEDLSQS